MRRTLCCLATLVLLLGVPSASSLPAFGAYTFVNIADTNTPAPSGSFTSFSPGPAIGSVAAFNGSYGGGSGIFTGYGGQITAIAKTGDPAPFGTFDGFGVPAKLGAVAFYGQYSAYLNGYEFGHGIFSSNGGSLTTISKIGDPAPTGTFTGLQSVAMYPKAVAGLDPNTVVFKGYYDGAPTPTSSGSGIFIWAGGTTTAVVTTSDALPSGRFLSIGDPALTSTYVDCCTPVPSFAFKGVASATGEGIFTMSNGVVTTIATKTIIPAHDFGNPTVLGHTVAFRINTAQPTPTQVPPDEIWSNYSGILERIVKAGDAAPDGTFIRGFSEPLITNSGITFGGKYANGAATGIFARLDHSGSGYLGPIEAIIKTGDDLFGSQVTMVGMMPFHGHASAQEDFSFSYTLSDGRSGIALALAIPEPATNWWVLLALILANARHARRSRG